MPPTISKQAVHELINITSVKLLGILSIRAYLTFRSNEFKVANWNIIPRNVKKELVTKILKACCSEPLNETLMTSSLPGAKYGVVYYKYLEQDKINTLKESKGYFGAMMILSS